MARKYYAIRQGRKTGIFTSWDETKNYVSGYTNAEYKSFSSMADAEQYLDNQQSKNNSDDGLQAYVDGSFDKRNKRYSYGVVLLENDTILETLKNADDDERYADSFQIAGECFGALNAIKWAINHQYPSVTIYYDYMGIEKWARKEWRANKPVSKDYVSYFDRFKKHIDIDFVKVKAHTGVEMNELADQLAKEALK